MSSGYHDDRWVSSSSEKLNTPPVQLGGAVLQFSSIARALEVLAYCLLLLIAHLWPDVLDVNLDGLQVQI